VAVTWYFAFLRVTITLLVIMSAPPTITKRQRNTTRPRSTKRPRTHAYLAHGHSQHAIHHDAEAAKLHAEE